MDEVFRQARILNQFFVPHQILLVLERPKTQTYAMTMVQRDVNTLVETLAQDLCTSTEQTYELIEKLGSMELDQVNTSILNTASASIALVTIDLFSTDLDVNTMTEQAMRILAIVEDLNKSNPDKSTDFRAQFTLQWFSQSSETPTMGGGPGMPPLAISTPDAGTSDFDMVVSQSNRANRQAVKDVLDRVKAHHNPNANANAQNKGKPINDCENIVVYILDTIPDTDVWENRHTNFPNHELLKRLDNTDFEIVGRGNLEVDHLTALDNYMGAAGYPMPDHGIFIAGTVVSLAPKVTIKLIEVLNRNGVGNMGSLIEGLKWIQADLAENPEITPIINMSLTFNIPLVLDHFLDVAPGSSVDQYTGSLREYRRSLVDFFANFAFARNHDVCKYVVGSGVDYPSVENNRLAEQWLLRPLTQLLEALAPVATAVNLSDLIAEQVSSRNLKDLEKLGTRWIFAASGNNGRNGTHPPALYPAAYNNVYGVGALDVQEPLDDSQPSASSTTPDVPLAGYSNFADNPYTDGLLTYGGVATDAMIGLYLHDLPHVDRQPQSNDSGWAEWNGTSFATGVMAGLVAAILCDSPRKKHQIDAILQGVMDEGGDESHAVPVKQMKSKKNH